MALNDKHLQKLVNSAAGREFAKYIGELILSLDTLGGIDFKDEKQSAIEGLARQLAMDKLKAMFSTLLSAKELNTIRDDRDDFSVEVKD